MNGTWADRASCLFWLARHDWPALEVAGVAIVGETPWRIWIHTVDSAALSDVRTQLLGPPQNGADIP